MKFSKIGFIIILSLAAVLSGCAKDTSSNVTGDMSIQKKDMDWKILLLNEGERLTNEEVKKISEELRRKGVNDIDLEMQASLAYFRFVYGLCVEQALSSSMKESEFLAVVEKADALNRSFLRGFLPPIDGISSLGLECLTMMENDFIRMGISKEEIDENSDEIIKKIRTNIRQLIR